MAKKIEYFTCKKCGCKIELLYVRALKLAITSDNASFSMFQRKLEIGYRKAGEILDWMEEMGFISAYNGGVKREVFITEEKFKEIYGVWEEI